MTYFEDATKDYTIFYPNGTNVTYNLDGGYSVDYFDDMNVARNKYVPSPNGGLRNLQDATSS